jgi:hypothetical protein
MAVDDLRTYGAGASPLSHIGLERAYAERCSDNSSIMRTVESLLTNAVKRFVGHIGDLADRDAGSATPNAWAPRPRSQGIAVRKESR